MIVRLKIIRVRITRLRVVKVGKIQLIIRAFYF